LQYREDNNTEQWRELAWKPAQVRVTTEIQSADLSELRDVTPPEQLLPGPSWTNTLVQTGVVVVCLSLLLVGWKLTVRRLRRRPVLSPEEAALKELDTLQAGALLTAESVDAFHTRLSDILRTFLERRYQFRAPEQTTSEFLLEMRQSPELTGQQQELLRTLLERCDLVKFARAPASKEECQELIQAARGFVAAPCPAAPRETVGKRNTPKPVS
jgi:hypothetical protein